MAYVSPNSTVKILTKVNLDSDYNHTFYFANVSAQTYYFERKVKATSGGVSYTLSNYTYQRVNNNTIRVEILADNLYDCNYMMFQNTAFGNKWFYAFITKVNYINNSVSEIEYAIDVMQTWYFDYELGDCFVEREHSTTDVAGDNLVPEPIDGGELIVSNTYVPDDGKMSGAVYLQRALIQYDSNGDKYYFTVNNPINHDVLYFYVSKQAYTPIGESLANVSNGLYHATGFMVKDSEETDYINKINTYAFVDPRPYMNLSGTLYSLPVEKRISPMTIGKFLSLVSSGEIYAPSITGSEDDIVYSYEYPQIFSKKSNLTYAQTTLGYDKGISASEFILNNDFIKNYFRSNNNVESNYTNIKNQKLFTAPFMRIQVCNNQGNTADYYIENFSSKQNVGFRWIGCLAGNPSWLILPYKYKGNYNKSGESNYEQVDWDNGVLIGNYPEPTYKGDTFREYMRNHGVSLGIGLLNSTISSLTGAFRGIRYTPKTHNVTFKSQRQIAQNASSLFEEIASTTANMIDIAKQAPNNYGELTSPSITTGTNRMKFRINLISIKPQMAKIVDDFFNMFGYQTNRVKIPNVKNPNVTLRPYWNYIKTNGCIIHPASDGGLPADDESDIASIYDKGITFWNKVNDDFPVGDYHFDNSPVTP